MKFEVDMRNRIAQENEDAILEVPARKMGGGQYLHMAVHDRRAQIW